MTHHKKDVRYFIIKNCLSLRSNQMTSSYLPDGFNTKELAEQATVELNKRSMELSRRGWRGPFFTYLVTDVPPSPNGNEDTDE